ncbi:hypothetical protein IWQ61_005691 [Dispira simplex]|nr:hypothetical protein IWQ61_005691 [Dispira simplex]
MAEPPSKEPTDSQPSENPPHSVGSTSNVSHMSDNTAPSARLCKVYYNAQGQHSNPIDTQRNLIVDHVFDEDNPRIKQDILHMIIQFLDDEGYYISKSIIYDEANIKQQAQYGKIQEIKRLKQAILDGDWAEADKLCTKNLIRHQRSFLYLMYRQQYLEFIERREYQKAYTCLNQRLKPLEHYQTTGTEFKDLCYLLTCNTVQDVASFKNWEGVGPTRENLAEHLQRIIDYETVDRGVPTVPPHRLVTLMKQAVAYQMESSRYLPETRPTVKDLLQDYSSFVIPNAVRASLVGHQASVKCAKFVGPFDQYIASGGSDNRIRLWDVGSCTCLATLKGHTSKIWDLACDHTQALLASASGDCTVKLWDIQDAKDPSCVATLTGHEGDVYSLGYHPCNTHIVSGGYDKTIRVTDVTTGSMVKVLSGHELSVSQVTFNPLGNLVVSGSKDKTIKFWDILSGTCIKTVSAHLGEVTSLAMNYNGTLLLTSSKDNSTRLWDVRMMKPVQKFKGHQNISKNFIRSGFLHHSLILSGSEDGVIYLWDQDSSAIVQRLQGHQGVVYSASWSNHQGLLCSCSDDTTVKTWAFDTTRPIVQ